MSGLPASEGWRRLHPVTAGGPRRPARPRLPLLLVISTAHSAAENSTAETDYLVVIALGTVVYGYIHWMVTRWRIEGDALRIETGLIRKDSKRLPLARIQAVDIVRPLLARMLGVSELRVRLAGSGSTDGRLAYLGQAEAAELRLALLAGHVDTEACARTNTGLPMAIVSPGRLIGSVLLSLVSHHPRRDCRHPRPSLDQFEPEDGGRGGGVPGRLPLQLRRRRVATALGPVQLHRGRGPRGRAHHAAACSRPFRRPSPTRASKPCARWSRSCGGRSAGAASRSTSPERRRATSAARARRSSARPCCRWGRSRTRGTCWPGCSAGPTRRARPRPGGPASKAPLSFHFLSAGHDDTHAVCVTGRINRATTWVPLEKSQSIRRVQGPLQRPLGLATVHVDVAGRRTRAEFRDRDRGGGGPPGRGADRAEPAARRTTRPAPAALAARVRRRRQPPPSGWYPDPSGRHEQRYWHDGRWTEQVRRRAAAASTGGAYDGAVKRIGKWSMERMPGV